MSLYARVVAYLGEPEEFGARVRASLRVNGLTQTALARAAQINESNLCRYINGRGVPSMETMLRIDAALEELTGGS